MGPGPWPTDCEYFGDCNRMPTNPDVFPHYRGVYGSEGTITETLQSSAIRVAIGGLVGIVLAKSLTGKKVGLQNPLGLVLMVAGAWIGYNTTPLDFSRRSPE